jgi:hypothetical protein
MASPAIWGMVQERCRAVVIERTYTLKNPAWRVPRIESIDYSSMLFGLAASHPKLGMKFFVEGTRFTFPAISE